MMMMIVVKKKILLVFVCLPVGMEYHQCKVCASIVNTQLHQSRVVDAYATSPKRLSHARLFVT